MLFKSNCIQTWTTGRKGLFLKILFGIIVFAIVFIIGYAVGYSIHSQPDNNVSASAHMTTSITITTKAEGSGDLLSL